MSGETEGNSVADEQDHCCARNSGIARGKKSSIPLSAVGTCLIEGVFAYMLKG